MKPFLKSQPSSLLLHFPKNTLHLRRQMRIPRRTYSRPPRRLALETTLAHQRRCVIGQTKYPYINTRVRALAYPRRPDANSYRSTGAEQRQRLRPRLSINPLIVIQAQRKIRIMQPPRLDADHYSLGIAAGGERMAPSLDTRPSRGEVLESLQVGGSLMARREFFFPSSSVDRGKLSG